MPYAVPQRTGFLDLSAELQLKIYDLLKPLVPPEPLTHLSREWHWCSFSFNSEDLLVNEEPALTLLLLNRATFESLAPHHYQNSLVRFSDASIFHSESLVQATNACLYNLRYVRCILNRLGNRFKDRTISGVKALITEWPELSHLTRFEVIFCLGAEFMRTKVLSRRPESPSGLDLEGQWSYIDGRMNEEFTGLERRALSTTLRGFRAVHGLKPGDIASWYELEHLSLTFAKVD